MNPKNIPMQRKLAIAFALAAGGLILVAAAVFLGVQLSILIVAPVRRMTGAMSIMAGGKLDVAIPDTDRKDEVGAMAQAMQVFRDNGLRAKALESETESIRDQSEIERRRREAVAQQEAAELSPEVAFFQVSGGRATARRTTAAAPARPATRPAPPVEQRVIKVAGGRDLTVGSNSDGWEEF